MYLGVTPGNPGRGVENWQDGEGSQSTLCCCECRHGHLELGNQQKTRLRVFPVSGKRVGPLSSKFRESLVEGCSQGQHPGALPICTHGQSGLPQRPQAKSCRYGRQTWGQCAGMQRVWEHRQPLPRGPPLNYSSLATGHILEVLS